MDKDEEGSDGLKGHQVKNFAWCSVLYCALLYVVIRIENVAFTFSCFAVYGFAFC
jgi:hypothetical protein